MAESTNGVAFEVKRVWQSASMKKYSSSSTWVSYTTADLVAHLARINWSARVRVDCSPWIMGLRIGITLDSSWLIHSLLQRVQGLRDVSPRWPRVVKDIGGWWSNCRETVHVASGNSRAIHLASNSSLLGFESLRLQNTQVG